MSEINSHGDGTSLSIEETNKLRIQLGLKPLTTDAEITDDGEKPKIDFVHKPAINLGTEKKIESTLLRVKNRQEARERDENLKKEIHVGVGEIEKTTDFIAKIAAKKAQLDAQKITADVDMENDDFNSYREGEVDEQTYDSRDLKGIVIAHKPKRFDSFGPTILTLKDTEILNEKSEDVLINVNIVDQEKSEKNIKNRRLGFYEDPVDSEDEEDPFAPIKPAKILAKYDEDEEKKHHFMLGSSGRYDMARENNEIMLVRDARKAGMMHIVDGDVKIATDYYTREELGEKMKKRKRKVRCVRNVQSQKLVKLSNSEGHVTGSKIRQEEGELVEDENNKEKQKNVMELKKVSPVESQQQPISIDDDEEVREEEDEYHRELQMVPVVRSSSVNEFARKLLPVLKRKNKDGTIDDMVDCLMQMKEETKQEFIIDDESRTTSRRVEVNNTNEFTKSIYNRLQLKRKEDAKAAAAAAAAIVVQRPPPEPVVKEIPPIVVKPKSEPKEDTSMDSGGWQPEEKLFPLPQPPKKKTAIRQQHQQKPSPSNSSNNTSQQKSIKLTDGVLGDEVQLNNGIFSALLLAQKKGYLEDNKPKELLTNPKNTALKAQHFYEEKLRYDDIDMKFSRRDRHSGPLVPFQDKKEFEPDVKLEYVDETGRAQDLKEAFRIMSHRFHGKGSGKIKTEKRKSKMLQESSLNRNVGETSMNSRDKMYDKMKKESRFCVALSGRDSIAPSSLKKGEKK